MELRRYLQVVRKWLWMIALGLLLAGGVAYGVSSLLPPVYSASATLLVRTSRDWGEGYGAVGLNQFLAATYAELLTKRPIMEEAVANLDLAPSTASELMTKVRVWVVPDTSVIRLEVKDNDPRLAVELANEIVSAFVQAQPEIRGGVGQDILVVEPAREPPEQVAPRTLFNALVAAIGGCALATGIAFLIEYLDDTLGTADDIHQSLLLPTLAALPPPIRRKPRLERGKKSDRTPIAMADPSSSQAEAYRALHARLQFGDGDTQAGRDGIPGTILVTSPTRRSEKAVLAANLGVVMAQAGLSVLLVDADLREPALHEAFGVTNDTGLSTLLAGKGTCEECVCRTSIPNLSVLASGPPPELPALSPQQIPRLLQELRTCADVVLLHGPPVLASANAMMLASQVEGTLLAIESGFTRRELAMQALEALRSVQATMMGAVLTRV